jgi:hypothetical protein
MPQHVLILANELITDARHQLPKSLRQGASTRELFVIAPVLTTRRRAP